MTFDLLIARGSVIDGTGNPWMRADVGIRDGRIAAVGRLAGADARKTIDAMGLMIAPGFIDSHTHSDVSLVHNPPADSHVRQGITTDIIGQCGYSTFPRTGTNPGLVDPVGVDVDWSTATEYSERLSAAGSGVNARFFVGHITVRTAVMGSEIREPNRRELEDMKTYVRSAMEAGAAGLSTGLDYSPQVTTEELVALCGVVAEYGGMYASHLRGYADSILDAVAEAIAVGQRAGIPVQLSHINVFGRRNWGKGAQVVEMVERARQTGTDVTADIMAYPTMGAWWGPRAVFSENVYNWREESSIGLRQLASKLGQADQRNVLRAETERRRKMEKHGFHELFKVFSDWRDIHVEGVRPNSRNEKYVGHTVADIAAEIGQEPVDVYFDLIVEEGEYLNSVHIAVSDEDYLLMMTAPWCMFSTDTIATSISRLTEPYNVSQQHPRGYGTFPRVLRLYVRERKVLRREEAIRKMTSLPAARFGLIDRGLIRPGMYADLVVFDAERIADTATYLHPTSYPVGIEHVLVNGDFVVERHEPTMGTPGRLLALAAGQ